MYICILLFIFLFVFDICTKIKSLNDFDEAVDKAIEKHDKTGDSENL